MTRVMFHGRQGDFSCRCTVVGETPRRYRVRWDEDVPGSKIKAGAISLIPKVNIEFTEEQ